MTRTEIAIAMSSVFDMMVMKDAARVLDQFGIPYDIDILDIHRNPKCLTQYVQGLMQNEYVVVIAGASGAAHLPGMIASHVSLPVIGVPIKAIHSIDGMDAVYSILQMPQGVPVASVALNGAKNAAILAMQILAVKHPSYLQLVKAYKQKQQDEAEMVTNNLKKLGYEQFLSSAK